MLIYANFDFLSSESKTMGPIVSVKTLTIFSDLIRCYIQFYLVAYLSYHEKASKAL